MADSGASFSELDAKLERQDLSRDNYDELLVFARALVRPRGPLLLEPMRMPADGQATE
jgi:hypothetical protein